jgi:cyclopropane fatty-acyl-phospholipid synthase-like methyltransferase
MNYRFAYTIGFHPWEDAASDPPFVKKAAELFAREEQGREAPFGSALDIGTGSGIWGIELARRGWQVTGIDFVQKALARAHDRVRQAGVEMRLIQGDVTALPEAGTGAGFRLILDTGTFHDFNAEQRAAMGRGVEAIAGPDATLLLLVWPKRRRPLIRGVSREEIEAAFPAWTVTHVEPSHFRLPKLLELLLRPDEHWYRLRRT